jgi:hypothetical protein
MISNKLKKAAKKDKGILLEEIKKLKKDFIKN